MDLTLTPAWQIVVMSDHPVAQAAGRELQQGLLLLGAPELPLVGDAPGPRIALTHGPVGERFVRTPVPHGLDLRADGPRGLLYAVYDLLEAMGMRWPAPGVRKSPTPSHDPLHLPPSAVTDRPALPIRSLVIGHDQFLAEATHWISWAARNRLNTIFIHTTIGEPALGACRLATWRARRHDLLPLIREHGLRLELGGHHLRDLLPRRLFRSQPTLFRHDGQRRTPDHNLCVSNPAALKLLQRMGAAFFRAYPEAEVYHLWPDDLHADGWCHCQTCTNISPADQTLIAANALAEVLPPDQSNTRVSFLAYHESATAPTLTPHAAVSLLFAPRPRSYAASIGATLNEPIATQLRNAIASFGTGGYLPHPSGSHLAVFEYYLDGILFKSSPPPLVSVIGADLSYYQQVGVGAVHILLTGDRPFRHAPLNAYLAARLAWSGSADPAQYLHDYALARTSTATAELIAAYRSLEAAWQPALMRDPRGPIPRAERGLRDLVSHPPLDMLDTLGEPRRTAELRLEELRRAMAQLGQGRAAWQRLEAQEGSASLADERAEWVLSAALLDFFALRQQLYVLTARGAPTVLLTEALDQAQSALEQLLRWAERYVPASAKANHLLLRTLFQLQLDQVADRHLLGPLQRLALRARRAGRLTRLLPRLLRLD